MTFEGIFYASETSVRIHPNLQSDITFTAIYSPTDLQSTQSEIGDPPVLEVTLAWSHATGNEPDDFLRFIVYRDEEEIARPLTDTYTDVIPNPGVEGFYSYEYHVSANYTERESDLSTKHEVIWDYTSVQERKFSGVPEEWAIAATYPNPFNPVLTTVVGLPETSDLTVKVYDITGRKVAQLASGSHSPGYHTFIFTGKDSNASGVYFVQAMVPGKLNQIRKVVLMK